MRNLIFIGLFLCFMLIGNRLWSIEKGLVGYWKFENITGRVIKDSSGKNNHGKVSGKPSLVKGKKGNCLKFDGIDDYIDCGNNASLNLKVFTIMAWVNQTKLNKWAGIISKTAPSTKNYLLLMHDKGAPYPVLSLSGENKSLYSKIPFLNNKWYHLTVVFTGRKLAFYLDSELINEVGVPLNKKIDFTDRPLEIGRYADKNFFCGKIDEVRIYDRALTKQEIEKCYLDGISNNELKQIKKRSSGNKKNGNLIANGGFEEGGIFPKGWSRRNGNAGAFNAMQRTTSLSRSGKACARITVPARIPRHLIQYEFFQEIPVQSGKTYQLSARIKSQNIKGLKNKSAAYIVLQAKGDTSVKSVSQYTVGTRDWKKVSCSLTVPKGAKKITASLFLFRSKGTAWFDDVSLVVKKPVSIKLIAKKQLARARKKGIYCFNFVNGKMIFAEESASGFIPVPSSVLYSQKKAYGWIVNADIFDKAGFAHHPLWYSQAAMAAKPGEFHTATFQVDLPDGDYELGLVTGGIARGYIRYLPFNVFVNERKVLSRIHHTGFRTHFIRVKVSGGKLLIRLVNDTTTDRLTDGAGRSQNKNIAAWQLCALTITPYQQRTAVSKQLAKLDKKAKKYILGGRNILPLPGAAPCPPLMPKWENAGYVAFVHQAERLLYSNATPTVSKLKIPADIQVARGEFEPITFGLHALKNMKSVSVSVSNLAGPSGAKIPAAAFDIRLARNMLLRIEKNASVYRSTPNILDPFKPFSVKAGQTKWVWLTVKIPSSQLAGKYTGNIRFTAANAGTVELPLTVEVLPFELPKNNIPTGMYWHLGIIEHPENMEKQFQDMVDHGMTTLMYYTGASVHYEIQGNKVVLDTNSFDKVMTAFMKVFPKTAVFTWRSNSFDWSIPSGDKKMEEAYKDMIAKLLEHCRKKGYPRPIFCPLDEPHLHKGQLKKFQRLGGLIKQVPGAEVECTVVPSSANTLKKYVDWRFYNGLPTFTKMMDSYDDNDKMCMYNMNKSERSAIGDRFAFGLTAWRTKPAAIGLWAYQWPLFDAFNDLDARSRDWCYAYPHKDGPLPTVDWEAVREGVDDLKYLTLLERLADAARKSNDPKRRTAAMQADKLMRGIRELTDVKYLKSNPAIFKRIRNSVIKQILLLMGK